MSTDCKESNMNKTALLGAALLLGASIAHANPSRWNFEYRGFYGNGSFLPDVTVSGTIAGEDLDHDGVIVESELSSLWIDMRLWSGDFAACDTWGDVDHHCRLDAFSFDPGNDTLSLSTRWLDVYPARLEYNSETFVSGVRYESVANVAHDYWVDNHYAFGAGTTLTITPLSPVPEPHAWLMLAGGVLALAARRRALVLPKKGPANNQKPA